MPSDKHNLIMGTKGHSVQTALHLDHNYVYVCMGNGCTGECICSIRKFTRDMTDCDELFFFLKLQSASFSHKSIKFPKLFFQFENYTAQFLSHKSLVSTITNVAAEVLCPIHKRMHQDIYHRLSY